MQNIIFYWLILKWRYKLKLSHFTFCQLSICITSYSFTMYFITCIRPTLSLLSLILYNLETVLFSVFPGGINLQKKLLLKERFPNFSLSLRMMNILKNTNIQGKNLGPHVNTLLICLVTRDISKICSSKAKCSGRNCHHSPILVLSPSFHPLCLHPLWLLIKFLLHSVLLWLLLSLFPITVF